MHISYKKMHFVNLKNSIYEIYTRDVLVKYEEY